MSTETLVQDDVIEDLELHLEHIACGWCYPPDEVDYYITYCGELVDGSEEWFLLEQWTAGVCEACMQRCCPSCGRG